MPSGPPFIDREVFDKVIRSITAVDGSSYQDIQTIYGDMSRLVVGWIATTSPADLQTMYNELSWAGNANVRAMHEAAKRWLAEHHPERYERLCGSRGD